MLHCGTVNGKGQPASAAVTTPGEASRVQLSPQPQRPAPVLKPQVSRKPSLDKNILLRKQQAVADQQQQQQQQQKQQQQSQQPTYEDTLKKCQSLTRTNSNPDTTTTSSNPPFNGKPPSPAVPPKPSLASRALASAKMDSAKKISHLPPTGLSHSPRAAASMTAGTRSSSLNRGQQQQQQQQQQLLSNNNNNISKNCGAGSSFLHDLENAMALKKPSPLSFEGSAPEDPTRPFPTHRLSSGEYDNVSCSSGSGGAPPPLILTPPTSSSTLKKVPPLPKRNDDTHLSWNRS